jgi:spermidine synthase
VHQERSPYQAIEVYEHEHLGLMLLLDGVVQTTEADEYCYHEMLVHPVLTPLDHIDRVLIIGGGDGGTLRRVLEHGPRQVVMCELDEAVVRVSRAYLPAISAGAFEDERANVVFSDGAAFVDAEEDAFDAIIVDSTDPVPIGPAAVLFSQEFYANCRRALRPGGVCVTQSGSPFHQPKDVQLAVGNMRTAFPAVEVHLGCVPTYPGVLWAYTVGTDGDPPSKADPARLAQRLSDRGVHTRYYTPDLHRAASVLPAFVSDLVRNARAIPTAPSVPGS